MASPSLHLPVVLDIPEPCSEDWNGLSGDERARHCKRCSKDVHNLSALTEAQIVELVSRDNVCVSLEITREGSLVSADAKSRGPGRVGRVLMTAALTALAACGHRTGGSPVPAAADSSGGMHLGGAPVQAAGFAAGNSASPPPVEIAPLVPVTEPVGSGAVRVAGGQRPRPRPLAAPPPTPQHLMGKPMMIEHAVTPGAKSPVTLATPPKG